MVFFNSLFQDGGVTIFAQQTNDVRLCSINLQPKIVVVDSLRFFLDLNEVAKGNGFT